MNEEKKRKREKLTMIVRKAGKTGRKENKRRERIQGRGRNGIW